MYLFDFLCGLLLIKKEAEEAELKSTTRFIASGWRIQFKCMEIADLAGYSSPNAVLAPSCKGLHQSAFIKLQSAVFLTKIPVYF
jgi:hypothetical protein